MALQTYEILSGNTFRLELPDGAGLRLDWEDAAGTRQSFTGTASGGEVSYLPGETGRYYLATREDATSDWCRFGVLLVQDLVDVDEERLVRELAGLNKIIADSQAELVQYQHTDASGTAVTRMTLNAAMRTRGMVEARLADFRRQRAGRLPVRMQ